MKTLFTCFLSGFISLIGFSQTTQTFTSSGNFVVPAGVTSIIIEAVGAGGAGGGNGGGGGGGGGYAKGTYTVVPGQNLTVTVGVAGGGSITGASSVNAFITAGGGENGFSVSNPNIGGGGAGGVASGGSINYNGGNGGGGYWTYFGGGGGGAAGPSGNGSVGGNTIAWTGICQTPGGSGGLSGGAPGGDGGKGAGFTDPSCNISDPSGNGLNYGGGGGGGNGNGGINGTGMNGFVSITYGGGCALDTGTTTVGITISADQNGVSYQWINCTTNSIIGGATNQNFTPIQTGNYAVIVDNGTCSDTSACVNVVVCNLTATTTVQSDTIMANEAGTYQWINCVGNIPVGGATGQEFIPAVTGTYAVIINDAGCIDTSACVNVVVCNLTATTTVQSDTIMANETGAYQWINCVGNIPIGGATGQEFIPSVNGTYAVIINDAGCIDTSACVSIVTLGIDNQDTPSFTVFPNPFHNQVQLLHAQGNEVYELTNSLGQLIWRGTHIETKDWSHLTNGIYFLRIITPASIVQVKIMRQ